MSKDKRANENAGESAKQHKAEDPPRDLAASNLCGDEDRLDHGGEHKTGGDGYGSGDAQEQDEQRRGDRARADAGKGDEDGDDESNGVFHGVFSVAAAVKRLRW